MLFLGDMACLAVAIPVVEKNVWRSILLGFSQGDEMLQLYCDSDFLILKGQWLEMLVVSIAN